MLHSAMVWASWAIGIVGVTGLVAGIVALIWLGPVVVSAVIGPIFSRFSACTKCIAVVVGVLAFMGAYWAGHHQAANECRDAELSAALRNKQIDTDIAIETAKEAQAALAESSTRVAASEKKVNDYADALKARPNAACILTADDFADGVRKRPGSK